MPLMLSLAFSGVSYAADLPAGGINAQDLQKEQERQRQRELERQKNSQVEQPAVTDKQTPDASQNSAAEQVHFQLKSVRFTKTEQLTREELTGVVKPWLDQSVSLKDLYTLVDQINQLYRTKGIYTSVALLPQQQIKDGIVIVQLVEGQLGEMQVEGGHWTDPDWVKHWVEPKKQGVAGLDMKALESDILLFNRLHDQYLQAQLRSGKNFGTTDILVNVNEPARNSFQTWADNYGFESSGDRELGVMYQRQKLWTESGKGLVYSTATKGSNSLALDYSSGWGMSRWRLGSNANYTRSSVINGPYVDADVDSTSLQLGVYSSYLAWSSTRAWLDLRTSFNRSYTETDLVKEPLSKTEIDRYSFTPNLTWIGANWRLNGSLGYSYLDTKDVLVPDNGRDYELGYFTGNGIWRPWRGGYLLARYERQFTGELAVPGVSAFNLGGATSIRGYRPGLISGDQGRFYQTEVHFDSLRVKDKVLDFSLFFDRGKVESVTDTNKLRSAGMAVSIYGNGGLSTDFSLAQLLDIKLDGHTHWQLYGRIAWSW